MRSLSLLLPIAMLGACGRDAPREPSPGTSDDVAIFEALLADACAHPFWGRGQSIVLDVPATVSGEDAASWKWQPPPAFIEAWKRRPGAAARWPKLSPCATQRVVEKTAVDSLLQQDHKIPASYERLRAAFPDARETAEVSLPAYSADGRAAAVFEVFDHEGVSSAADVVEFERGSAGWRQVQVHNVWVRSF